MKRACTFTALLLFADVVPAQNLVPNGSFEEFTECPDFFGQVERCTGWHNLGAAQSADYFNACADGGFPDVPQSSVAWQEAKDGSGYMGAATFLWQTDYYREFFGTQLTDVLQPGIPVHICFHVSAAGFSPDYWHSARWLSKGMGVRFYTENPGYWSYQNQPYENNSALYLNQVLSDTAGWIIVSGDYIPDSAYNWIVVGNFFEDSLSAPLLADVGGGWEVAYALVDDLSVSNDLTYCGTTGINEPMDMHVLSVAFEPSGSLLRIVVPGEDDSYSVEIHDVMGRFVIHAQERSMNRQILVEMSDFPSGAYLVNLTGPQGVLCSASFIRTLP